MAKIPEIKKKISSFLRKEDGKISKDKLIKTGIILTTFALASAKIVSANHRNSVVTHTNAGLAVTYDAAATSVVGSHNHHGNHSSHNSHGSHSSGW